VRLAFGFGWDVAFGELGAFAEEELFHLFFHDFLGVGVQRIQAVFVHDHLGVFQPQLPGIFGDVFVDALADFALPGWAVEVGKIVPEFHA